MYHPDVNGGSPQAEQKMKEINEAYREILNMRKNGTSGTTRNYGYRTQQSSSQNTNSGGYANSYQAARSYIQFGRYAEAERILQNIPQRDAEWYYLSAMVCAGTDRRINALEYARQAVMLDPGNPEYQALLRRLEYGNEEYQQESFKFGGFGKFFRHNPLALLCCANLLCTCLCNACSGTGNMGNMGNMYGRPW